MARESPLRKLSPGRLYNLYSSSRRVSVSRVFSETSEKETRYRDIRSRSVSLRLILSLSLCRLINDYRETCLAWPLREIQPRPRRAYNTHPRCTRCMYIARIKGQPWCPSLFFLPSTCFALFLNTHFFFFLPFPNVEESLRTIRRVFGTNFRRFGCFLPVWRFIQIL